MQTLYIIVPFYNVATYLRQCLDSIKAQTYKHFIAICVDDGSSDESRDIALAYQQTDSRFIVLSQVNQGVGVARNTAMDYIAQQNVGDLDYVGFVDSDDVIAKDYFANCIFALESHPALSLLKSKNVCRFYDEAYDSSIFAYTHKPTKGYVHSTYKNLTYKCDVWRCVFRWRLLKLLRFPPFRNGEDVIFGICANTLAQRVIFIESARYFYRNRTASLSNVTERLIENGDDLAGFKFLSAFFLQYQLFETITMPTNMIRPPLDYLQTNPRFFTNLQKAIKELCLTPLALKKQKVLQTALESANFAEYMRKSMSIKEYFKYHFRLKYNKREKIIRLFGKTLYQNKGSVKRKYS